MQAFARDQRSTKSNLSFSSRASYSIGRRLAGATRKKSQMGHMEGLASNDGMERGGAKGLVAHANVVRGACQARRNTGPVAVGAAYLQQSILCPSLLLRRDVVGRHGRGERQHLSKSRESRHAFRIKSTKEGITSKCGREAWETMGRLTAYP